MEVSCPETHAKWLRGTDKSTKAATVRLVYGIDALEFRHLNCKPLCMALGRWPAKSSELVESHMKSSFFPLELFPNDCYHRPWCSRWFFLTFPISIEAMAQRCTPKDCVAHTNCFRILFLPDSEISKVATVSIAVYQTLLTLVYTMTNGWLPGKKSTNRLRMYPEIYIWFPTILHACTNIATLWWCMICERGEETGVPHYFKW